MPEAWAITPVMSCRMSPAERVGERDSEAFRVDRRVGFWLVRPSSRVIRDRPVGPWQRYGHVRRSGDQAYLARRWYCREVVTTISPEAIEVEELRDVQVLLEGSPAFPRTSLQSD